MTERVLRWGLLSTARINLALLPALHECARAEPVAVASRDLDVATRYADEHQLPKAHGSYEALLADPEIDVVYVPLPNRLHAEWTIRAAEAGKHVLCEKPLASTLEQVDAVTAAAIEHGVVVAEAFMYRHHPQTLRVGELVHSGEIGDVQLVRGSFSFTLDRSVDIRLDAGLDGGSAWDLGVYPISYARTMFGRPPAAVTARQHEGATGVDLTCVGAVTFDSGGVALFDSSFELPFRASMEIVGSTGMLVVPNPYKPGRQETILCGPADDDLHPIAVGAEEELYTYEVDDITDAILGIRPSRVTLADSRENVATVLAALSSARTGGTPVAVDR
jgi:xylose dehydrogenase (NAD/NADP)